MRTAVPRYTCGVFFRRQNSVPLLLITSIAFCMFLHAQTPATVQVVIKVTDQTGAPIPKAHIRLVPPPDRPPAAMETGQTGELTLQLKPGGRALFTSAQGFKSDVRHIEVAGSQNGNVIPVMLHVGSFGGPVVVLSEEEAAKYARQLFLSAMPYHKDWSIRPDEFAAMAHINVVVRNPETHTQERYGGVRMSDLLAQAGAPIDDASIDIAVRSYVTANDEVFSLAELMPGLHEGEILVADSVDGHPLAAADGPFMLVVSADKRRVRWVKRLQWIKLHP